MSRFATPVLVLGLLGLALSGVLAVYRPSWRGAWPAALLVGALLVLVALYLSLPGLRRAWGRRTTRYGLNTAVMVALILGVIALVEAVSYRHSWRVDLTENRRYSLAPQTVKILRDLTVPVRALAFFSPDQPGKRAAEDLLQRYAAGSGGKFAWEVVDADRNPLVARKYGVERYGTVVLEARFPDGRTREEKVEADEEKITNGLIRVTRPGKRVVYFLAGHGERELGGAADTGLGRVKAEVEKLNYETRVLLLAREPKVPDDAAILVIAGPQRDLLPSETEALTAYLARAGKVLVLLDPFQAPGLVGFLDRYGIVVGHDLILDDNPQAQLLGFGAGVPVVGDYAQHPITRDFRLATLFPLARTVGTREPAPAGVTVQVLARSSRESWVTDEAEARSGQVRRAGPEQRRAHPVAAVATVDAPDAPAGRGGAKARLVVVGDSDFATNQYVELSGNRDFFLNTLSWLAEEEDLIAIRPRESTTRPVFLTAAQGQVLFWVPVVLLPLAMVVAGGLALAHRRGR